MRHVCLGLCLAALWWAPVSAAAADDATDGFGWPDRVRIVYLPAEGRAATIARYEELTRYLQAVLGTEVEPVSFEGYREMFAWMALGDFELAYLSPSTFCQARAWVDLNALAMEADAAGRTGYRSLIISRADRGLSSVEELGGRIFAFTDPESTSGFLVPLAHFLTQRGLTPGMMFGQASFGGDHLNVIRGVIDGRYDAGVVSSIHLERILADRSDQPLLKVLWQSEMLPGLPICARSATPDSFQSAVAVALFNFGADPSRPGRLRIGGFAPAHNRDFKATDRLESFRP